MTRSQPSAEGPTKAGKCRWCLSAGEVYKDSLLCESCDDDTIYCTICKGRYHWETKCRHVFQDRYFEWRGSGVRADDQEMYAPFHRLLSAMGEEFVRALKAAIMSGKFHTWMAVPMIGGGGHLSLYGMPHNCRWGEKLIELGESERAEQLSDGYRWLASLYDRKTPKANRTTIGWIDQWLWPLSPEGKHHD